MQKKLGGKDYDIILLGDPFSGALVSPPDFNMAVAWGLLAPNYTRAFAIGYNPDVDTGTTPEDAWGSNGLYPWLPAPTSLEVVSTGASDANAGTGAHTISITTLDVNYVSTSQTITLNGLTPVAIPGSPLRINACRCTSAGSGGVNAGDIIIRDAGAGATRGIILTGIGVMRQAPFTVPAGFTLAVKYILLAVDSPTGATGKFASISTYFKSATTAIIQPLQIGNTNTTPYNHFSDPPLVIQEKTDFALRINTVSDNNTIITAGWNGILRSNVQT
jgi:hypothetical protein